MNARHPLSGPRIDCDDPRMTAIEMNELHGQHSIQPDVGNKLLGARDPLDATDAPR